MEISIGDKVKYTFPNPVSMNKRSVIGRVDSIHDSFIIMITDDNVRLKINFKNFENLVLLEKPKIIVKK